MFQYQKFPICIPQVTHCSTFCKQGLSRIILPRTSFCQLFTIRFETFLFYIASFWCDSGGKLSFVSIFHSLSMYIFLNISVAYSFLDETVQFSYVSNFATTKSTDLKAVP